MAHTIGFDELNGFEVTTQIASAGGGKSLTVITTVGDFPNVRYSVVGIQKNYHEFFTLYSQALEAFNNL